VSLKNKTSIFDSPSQLLAIDPATIRLISDRCLIRDLGDPERIGSIIIPEAARDKARDEWGVLRIGLVIAVGPGDRFIEVGIETYPDCAPFVRRKLITTQCAFHAPKGGQWFDVREYELNQCPACLGTDRIPVTIPPQCSPGDKVLYSRRREAEFWVNGERLSVVNAEQSVLAVLEDD
jgi:co-chaperonin GroES (HSP10)